MKRRDLLKTTVFLTGAIATPTLWAANQSKAKSLFDYPLTHQVSDSAAPAVFADGSRIVARKGSRIHGGVSARADTAPARSYKMRNVAIAHPFGTLQHFHFIAQTIYPHRSVHHPLLHPNPHIRYNPPRPLHLPGKQSHRHHHRIARI